MNRIRQGSLLLAALVLLGLAVWLLLSPLFAEPVRNSVLDEVRITEYQGQVAIAVRFPCPVRYLTHFPQTHGRELRIRLDPVPACNAEREAFAQRESVRPRHAEAAALDSVSYEGDIAGGPFLNLSFTAMRTWQVQPDKDFRGLLVLIAPVDPATPGP